MKGHLMAPKKTTPKSTRASGTSADTSIPLSTPRLELPGLIRPAGPDATPSGPQHSTQLTSSEALPGLLIQDLTPAVRESTSSDSHLPADNIRDYALLPQERTLLPAVMTQGLRIYRGRIFAEVQYTSTDTVMVGWDDGAGTYRATRSKEAHPSGPALHFDSRSNTWRVSEPRETGVLIESAVHRPAVNPQDTPPQALAPATQSNTSAVYIDTRHYVWDGTTTHHHGYVVMHRRMRLDDSVGPLSHHAFRDDNGSFVSVEPPAHPIDQPAEQLPAWTDRDIWNLYGLQGTEITRFRTEAHRSGGKPHWARVRTDRMENAYLFDELRRWLGPDMDRDMFNRLLEHQKRTPAEWVKHLESVSLYRDTSPPQTPSPPGSTPKTPELPSPSPRQPTPSISETENSITPTYGDPRYYTWDLDQSSFHGYVQMQRKSGLDDSHGPLTQLAFREGARLTVVRPTDYSIYQASVLRPFWRDIDIWNLYRIEGPDIVRFRRDVALHQKPPGWVKQREYPSQREQLIDYLRLWTNPDSPLKSREQILARFQPYNLSVQQLARLCKELSPTGQFKNLINDEVPGWVRTHQERTRLVTNERLFEPFLPEIDAEIIQLRNQGEGSSLLKASLTTPFFQELLRLCGFKRNKHNYLYRTDIPAVFKVDDRTPFEIAQPAAMVPQVLSASGATSEIPVSAMFSLKTAMDFANEGKGVTGNESHQTISGTSTPNAQRILFCYLLDTRNVEVVAGQDNRAYNSARLERNPKDGKTWFPSMKMEGHVSMSPIGFTSRRVWLVNSGMTRAATVEDIHLQALAKATGSNQNPADAIKARTRTGESNRVEYDELIDEVAKAGKRVIELPAGQEIFSDDIVFPPETITL
jgi:hypothetical protein